MYSCEKDEIVYTEDQIFQQCHESSYEIGGLIGVYECIYGSLENLVNDPDAPFHHRKYAMDHLGLRKDPLRDIIKFTVDVEDPLGLVSALDGTTAEIGDEIEFYTEDPEYGYFIDWDVMNSFIGREDGPKSNPIAVSYPMSDNVRTISLKPRYKIYPPACPEGCDSEIWIDNLTQPDAYVDDNGYTHLFYNGGNYFTVKMRVADVDPEYRVNGIPLVQVEWDSDYWMILENLQLSVSYYRPFGLWTQGFSQPLAYMNTTITLRDAAGLYGMTNAVGYAIDNETCLDCPYSESLYGIRTQVNEDDLMTQKSILINRDMIGDTLTVYTKAKYAYTNQYGRSETVKDSIKLIIN